MISQNSVLTNSGSIFGSLDLLVGKFFFQFECPDTICKNIDPDLLFNKISRALHEKCSISYKNINSFYKMLELLAGSRGKRKYMKVLEGLEDSELDALCLWMQVYSKNNYDDYSSKTLIVGFDPKNMSAIDCSIEDITNTLTIKHAYNYSFDSFEEYFIKTIEMTIVPSYWWIIEFKNKKMGLSLM